MLWSPLLDPNIIQIKHTHFHPNQSSASGIFYIEAHKSTKIDGTYQTSLKPSIIFRSP